MTAPIDPSPKGQSDVTRSLVHTVRVVAGRNWERYASTLTAQHVAITEAMPEGTEDNLVELAKRGDPEALAFLIRCQVLAAAAAMVELCRASSALNEFATMDEALGAAEAAFAAPGLLDVEGVHAALLGVGELVPALRVVDPESAAEPDGEQEPDADPAPELAAALEHALGDGVPLSGPSAARPDSNPAPAEG